MTECAHQASLPCEQSVLPCESERSARSLVPLPKTLLSPGWVSRRTAVLPSRPSPTIETRLPSFAWMPNPHSPGELWKVQKNWRELGSGVGSFGVGEVVAVLERRIASTLKYSRLVTSFRTWVPCVSVMPGLVTHW